MLLRRSRPDPELLTLFDESGRTVQRAALLLRDLLADYPERAALARDIVLCEQEGDRIVHDIHHRLEDEADRIVRAAVASLFVNGIDPMIVIRWKDIFETLESAVDACETVANVLEGICLKRAAGNGRG